MRLSSFSIKNFRAIVNETFAFYNYTTLIGPNNCGKSTVLSAIQLLLNQEKPAREEWNDPKNPDIAFEAEFTELTEDDRKVPGIAGLVFGDRIRIRATYTKGEDAIEVAYLAFAQEEDIDGWSSKFKDMSPELRALAEKIGISTNDEWKRKGAQERLRSEIRASRPQLVHKGEASWTDEGISIPEALRQGLPRVLIVPAVRNAVDESKVTQRKNIFKEILESTILPEIEATDEYKAIQTGASKLRERIQANGGELPGTSATAKDLSQSAGSIVDIALSFSVEVPDAGDVFGSSAELIVSDGKAKTSVGLQGHGAQRSIIFALINYVAKRGDPKRAGKDPRAVIILFEEPELYIHPQMLRALKNVMKSIANREGWQIVATTHSPIMVDVADHPQSLIILRRDGNSAPIKSQLSADPFLQDDNTKEERRVLRAVLDFHPTVCEAFFASSTVLVEGDSELAVLSWQEKFSAARGLKPNAQHSTTIISCGGKWTIPPIARLLKEYNIPFKVVHDTDSDEDPSKNADGKKNSAVAANERIAALVPADRLFKLEATLEDILYEKKGVRYQSDKPLRAWKQMQTLVSTPAELPKYPHLTALFDFVFPVKAEGKPPEAAAGKG